MKCPHCGFTANTSDDFESHDCPNPNDSVLNEFYWIDYMLWLHHTWFLEWKETYRDYIY